MGKRIKPMLQMTRTECGLCCVAMICQFFGKYKPMTYYRKYIHGGRDGASIREIVNVLMNLGIDAQAKVYNSVHIEEISAPILAILDNNHFVIVEKRRGKSKIVVNDPSIGKIVMSKEEFENRVGRIIVTTRKTECFTEENGKNEEWSPFFRVLLSHKRLFFLSVFFSVLIYLSIMFLPVIAQKILDDTILFEKIGISNSMIGIVLVLVLGYIILSLLKNRIAVEFEKNVDETFLYSVIDKLTNFPYSFFELRTSADLLFRLNLLNNIRTLVSDVIVGVLDITGVLFAVIYAMSISWRLLGFTVIILALMCAMILKVNSKIVQLNYYELSELTNITLAETELVNSIYDIKLLHMEDTYADKIKKEYKRFSLKFQQRNWWSKLYNSMLQFFQFFVPFILLGFNLINLGMLGMTLGEAIAFFSISLILVANSISFIQRIANIKLMKNSLSRINEILLEDEKKYDSKEIESFNELLVKNVSFSYAHNMDLAIKDVNIHVGKGKKIAIVGGSGSGKSTLIKLIVGLYEAASGEVLYNGFDIRQMSKCSMKDIIGVVAQDVTLFNKSIKDNIVLNREDVSKEELYDVLKQVGMLDEVLAMPMREETLLSELGKNISGGQKQRLAMARTLIGKPEVLIMDEATSSLDGLNEKELTELLNELECAQIIVSHRLSSIKNVDYIYVMKDGEIVESGTLDELLGETTYFYKFFESQLKIADVI